MKTRRYYLVYPDGTNSGPFLLNPKDVEHLNTTLKKGAKFMRHPKVKQP